MSYLQHIPINLGEGDGGKTLSAQLIDSTGNPVGDPITTGFIDFGNGNYGLTAAIPDGFAGFLCVEDTENPGVVIDTAGIDPQDAEDIIKIVQKTAMIGSFAMSITSPFDRNGVLEIVQGDDWPEGYALQYTARNYIGFPLDNGSSRLIVTPAAEHAAGNNANAKIFPGTVVQNGQTVVCTFPMTAAQTAAFTGSPPDGACNYLYQVIVVSEAGLERTLKKASMTVEAKLD